MLVFGDVIPVLDLLLGGRNGGESHGVGASTSPKESALPSSQKSSRASASPPINNIKNKSHHDGEVEVKSPHVFLCGIRAPLGKPLIIILMILMVQRSTVRSQQCHETPWLWQSRQEGKQRLNNIAHEGWIWALSPVISRLITPLIIRVISQVTHLFSTIYQGYFTPLLTGRGPSCRSGLSLPQRFPLSLRLKIMDSWKGIGTYPIPSMGRFVY